MKHLIKTLVELVQVNENEYTIIFDGKKVGSISITESEVENSYFDANFKYYCPEFGTYSQGAWVAKTVGLIKIGERHQPIVNIWNVNNYCRAAFEELSIHRISYMLGESPWVNYYGMKTLAIHLKEKERDDKIKEFLGLQ